MADETRFTTKGILTCRQILCIMVITCFMVQYMVRINMSIAIVEMVAKPSNLTLIHGGTFQWDEHKKNDILGWFYWGSLLTAIPGGRLSEIYGTRKVLGIAMLLASLLTIVTPFACYLHYYCILAVRTSLGLALGVSWPSIPPMAVKWVAPADTSKFMGHTMACALGAALTLPVCGYIIAYLGWPSVFYITGALALVWSILWFYFVYDSPRQHPRISDTERESIESEMDGQASSFGMKKKTPWLRILSSKPVWAIIVADICIQFNTNIIMNELPSYVDEVLHFNIKANGWLSSLPYFTTYAAAVIFTSVADNWRKYGTFSLITIRKLFTSISFWVPNILYLIQVFWGYDRIVSILVFTLAQGFLAASTAGVVSNSMDISPVYSGTIFGIAFTGGASTGYISAKLVAFVVNGNTSFEQWRYIFLFLIGINLIGSVFYLIFASAEVHDYSTRQMNGVELRTLKSEAKYLDETTNLGVKHDLIARDVLL